MSEWQDIIVSPFFIRALGGGILVAILSSFLGIHVVMRRASLYGEAIAHSSLTGVALALLFGWPPLLITAILAIGVAWLLPQVERKSRLPIDNLLGALLPTVMAIGLVLLVIKPGYQPDLLTYLFGNILTISWTDLYWLAGLVIIGLVIMIIYRRQLTLTSFSPELAQTSGVNVKKIDRLYYLLLALTVVASLRLVGIILVNSLLIVPAITARLGARSLRTLYWVTPVISLITVITGLAVSVALDWPSGPAIALVAGLWLLLGLGWRTVKAS